MTDSAAAVDAARAGVRAERHDDTVLTVLRFEADDSPNASLALYRHLADLLMQNRSSTLGPARTSIFAALERTRPLVADPVRQQVARLVATQRQPQSLDFVSWLLADPATPVDSFLGSVRLTDRNWLTLLPRLETSQRSAVTARTDLADEVQRALLSLGQPVFLLGQPESAEFLVTRPEAVATSGTDTASVSHDAPETTAPEESSEAAQAQVRELIARIEQFRDARETYVPRDSTAEQLLRERGLLGLVAANDSNDEASPDAPDDHSSLLTAPISVAIDWLWECDRAGRLYNVSAGALAEPKIVQALPALRGRLLAECYPTAASSRRLTDALSKRSSFRDIILVIEDGPLTGQWQLAAVPVFDSFSGVFTGFRGSALRMREEPVTGSIPDSAAAPASTATVIDMLGELAHETRTPLNAIMGYAQLIGAEPFGTISDAYRAQTALILAESQKLLEALDDLADSNRLERGTYPVEPEALAVPALVDQVIMLSQPEALRRHVKLTAWISPNIPSLWADQNATQRALARLLHLALSESRGGEALVLDVQDIGQHRLAFVVNRPQSPLTNEHAATAALSPIASQKRISAGPLLGVSFGLNLVQQYAQVLSGQLLIHDDRFELQLPAFPAAQQRRGW